MLVCLWTGNNALVCVPKARTYTLSALKHRPLSKSQALGRGGHNSLVQGIDEYAYLSAQVQIQV